MKSCPQCPWRRTVQPGALGGSEPEVYIGQSVGPYILPCHMHYINDPNWRREDTMETPQCIGAAQFRANIGLARLLPDAVLRANPDCVEVFKDHAEFLAHHRQISVEQARYQLSLKTPTDHLRDQLNQSSNIVKISIKA